MQGVQVLLCSPFADHSNSPHYWFNIARETIAVKTFHTEHGMTRLGVSVSIGVVLLLSFVVAFLWRNADPQWVQGAFARSMKKLQLLQAMSRELLASAEAEKSAVMADTDEASQTLAEQSRQASHNVETARRELEPLLGGNRWEAHLFQEFSRCWDKLQAIDREVLSLAVQNTNLKALRLSFGPAAEAIRRMEDALTHLMDVVSSSPDAVGLTRLAAQAIIDALNIYTLQAPHIAESTGTRMEEMEAVMHSLDAQVTNAFQSLQARVGEPGQPFLDAAWAAYKDFQNINADIIDLSRQNSNLRSFALSLEQKRKMTAQCQEVLVALQETVRESMAYKATK
jgi:Four helix bundle sensory module for signal transduction